jgi:hypothetical protein
MSSLIARVAVVVMMACVWPLITVGAEITNVIDAFDSGKPFDGILALRFQHLQRRSLIVREWICNPDDNKDASGKNPFCPNAPQVIDTRQMRSTEVMNVLNVDIRAGLHRDLEFYATIPLVLGWQSKLDHDSGVNSGNSMVDSELSASLLSLPYESANRIGLGDVTLGIKYAPIHADRAPHNPSWVIGFEYLAPIGETRAAGNTGVGGSIHGITLYTAISRRLAPWVEPYFKTHGTLRLRSGEPFDYAITTQTLRRPGDSLGITMGAEFYPWHPPSEKGQYLIFDLNISAEFTFEGREFTELFDALGDSTCDPMQGCNLTLYTRDAGVPGPNGVFRTSDGVTDVEQYGRLGMSVGVAYQPLSYLRIRLGFEYQHVTSHYLTFADAGKDLDGQGDVQLFNSRGQNEYNPKYNENIDDYGKRFRLDDSHQYQVTLSIEGQL